MQAAVVAIVTLVLTGCFFNLREKEDFKSWYYGDPGLAGALGEADCDRYADKIEGPRHPYYLHFRTPEILLQPQGGAHYPERQTAESRAGGVESNQPRCEKVAKGWETFRFDAVDAGWVDTLIPYRKSSTVNDGDRGMGEHSLAYAEGLLYNTGVTAVMKAPVYIVHDILKTLYIPVAGTYYLFKPDEPPQPATAIIQVQGDAPAEDALSDGDGSGAMVATETAPDESPAPAANETSPAADDVDASRAPAAEEGSAPGTPLAAGEEPAAPPVDDDARAVDAGPHTDPGSDPPPPVPGVRAAEQDAPPAPASSAEAPAEPSAADPDLTGEAERGGREEQDGTAGEGISAASGAAGEAVESDASTARAEEASSPSEHSPEAPAEEDRVGAAVTSLTAVAKGAAASEEGAAAPPTTDEERGEILEEDLLAPAPGGDAGPGPETQDLEGRAEGQEATDPGDLDAASDSRARVSADQRAVPPQEPAPLAPIDRVRVAKGALHQKVAFIGFFSRAVNIDAETKAGLQARFWPAVKSECRDNLVLVRRGDAGYPGALDSLVRDPYGRMNSFELVTLARFSGLNAVVAGTIIDIRVANTLSGLLWYKTPEGQLRITILVEVFDAETGTKLFDRTYIREEEVNELDPGADGRPRPEDLPVLEAVLQSVALDMGEDVCDALEDQPWRAFVSGIDGNRVTLSAGQGAGLQPGNILGVYNSQIIDGLNNQQFFLTGEKVGRIQLINVYPNRSEGILIEGQGVRDYSVAMPD